MNRLIHELNPIYSADSKVMILGSFPSVKSREVSFYYGNQRNRFWKVISSILERDVPESNRAKKEMILDCKIALWDVIQSCEINGSSDSSIKNAKVNNIERVLSETKVKLIVCNGKKAYDLFNKYVGINSVKVMSLPSTSPANASYSFEKLVENYRIILNYLN